MVDLRCSERASWRIRVTSGTSNADVTPIALPTSSIKARAALYSLTYSFKKMLVLSSCDLAHVLRRDSAIGDNLLMVFVEGV